MNRMMFGITLMVISLFAGANVYSVPVDEMPPPDLEKLFVDDGTKPTRFLLTGLHGALGAGPGPETIGVTFQHQKGPVTKMTWQWNNTLTEDRLRNLDVDIAGATKQKVKMSGSVKHIEPPPEPEKHGEEGEGDSLDWTLTIDSAKEVKDDKVKDDQPLLGDHPETDPAKNHFDIGTAKLEGDVRGEPAATTIEKYTYEVLVRHYVTRPPEKKGKKRRPQVRVKTTA